MLTSLARSRRVTRVLEPRVSPHGAPPRRPGADDASAGLRLAFDDLEPPYSRNQFDGLDKEGLAYVSADGQTHEPMTASLAAANSISHLDVTFRYRRRSTRSSVGGGAEGQMLDRQGSALENELMFDAKLLEAAEGYEDGFEAGLPSSLDTSPGFGSPETVSDSEGDAIVRCV